MNEQAGKVSIHIDEWLQWHEDELFLPEDILRFYNWQEVETKKAVANRLYYLAKTRLPPVLRKIGRQYRVIELDYDLLDFKRENPMGYFDIKYPFGLENYVKTPRRSLVIVGGVPQSGKTAYAHNLFRLNFNHCNTILWDTENSDAELHDRLSKHVNYMEWPSENIRSRSSNFEDVIGQEPDALHIIDYLDVPDNAWEIKSKLRAYRDSLKGGVAVIVLQKPPGRDLPYGKEPTRWLPRLVIAMEPGLLKIVKGKSWVRVDVNPDGLRWSFKLVQGERFVNILPLVKKEVNNDNNR